MRFFDEDDLSTISKIYIGLAAVDCLTGFHRIAQRNCAGAVFDFVLAGFMLYAAWWYRDF